MDLNTIPSAPASTDNATVILWVVGVLFVGLCLVVRHLANRIAASEAASQKREQDCLNDRESKQTAMQAKIDERDKKITELLQSTITHGHSIQIQTTAAIDRMADSIDKLSRTIDGTASGKHEARQA